MHAHSSHQAHDGDTHTQKQTNRVRVTATHVHNGYTRGKHKHAHVEVYAVAPRAVCMCASTYHRVCGHGGACSHGLGLERGRWERYTTRSSGLLCTTHKSTTHRNQCLPTLPLSGTLCACEATHASRTRHGVRELLHSQGAPLHGHAVQGPDDHLRAGDVHKVEHRLTLHHTHDSSRGGMRLRQVVGADQVDGEEMHHTGQTAKHAAVEEPNA